MRLLKEHLIASLRFLLESPAGRWLAVALWTAVIFTFSSLPSLPRSLALFGRGAFSSAAHAAEYALLAFLLFRALQPRGADRSFPARAPAAAFLAALALAALDEAHQHWIPGRQASLVDLGADLGGILPALLLVAFWKERIRRTGKPPAPSSSRR